ncbi:MAG: diguanylate cyclase [Actinomycetota bacterium]|nr:diguanylate cyclase [Actinomycetota bacterium]
MRADREIVEAERYDPASPAVVRDVLDGLPGPVCFWDRDLRNVLANRAFVDFFGLAHEAIAGAHMREVVGEAVFTANLPFVTRALAGEQQTFDRTLVDGSGRVRHTQASYVPHWNDGVVDGLIGQVTDVTDRVNAERQAQYSAQIYRSLAASVPNGFVLLFDSELRFLIAEGALLGSFGHSPTELEGRTIHEALPAWLAAELEPRYRAALAGDTVEWERRLQDRVFSLKAGPVTTMNGEVFAGTVIAQDVTAARRAQAVQSALHEVATSVARAVSPQLICHQIALSLTGIFNAETAAVVRFAEPGRGELIAMAPIYPEAVHRELTFGPDDWSATAQVAATGRAALVNYRTQRDGVVGALQSEGLLAGAAAPIHHEGALWGAIALGTQAPERLTDDLLSELTRFAELVQISLGNLQAWSTLAEQAGNDALTGLPNRRSFDAHLEREVASARRDGRLLSLAMMDIDHFKKVNDAFGHPAGDRVLTDIAAILTGVARGSEMIARIGGEEFVWVLPGTSAAGAVTVADRARRAVADHDFGPIGQVTISIGISSTADSEETALLDAADQALYRAKRSGRNTVISHDDDGFSPSRPMTAVGVAHPARARGL